MAELKERAPFVGRELRPLAPNLFRMTLKNKKIFIMRFSFFVIVISY